MTKKKQLWIRVLCIVLASLLALVGLVLLAARAYFRLPVGDYYRASEKGFVIPGLGDGFVPQGLDYDGRSDCFFVTGYMADGSASPVYLVERGSGDLKKTLLLSSEDGTDYTGHAGGIVVWGEYVYVAGGADYCMLVYDYDDLLGAENGARVTCTGRISTGDKTDGVRVSALACDGERLWAVEFYRDPNYQTPDSHKVTLPGGDCQQALAVAYYLSEEAEYGVEPTPVLAYSLPDQVQGMCFDGDMMVLSCSYGAAFSTLKSYSVVRAYHLSDLVLQGTEIPVYAPEAISNMKIPPMSEEIVVVDGRLYTMCESASEKYIFGKFTSAKWCYATETDQLK